MIHYFFPCLQIGKPRLLPGLSVLEAFQRATLGTWAAIGVSAVGAVGSIVAGRQKAPQAAVPKPVDIQEESAKALAANHANLGQATALAGRINSFNQSEAARLLEQSMPGFGKLQAQLMGQIDSDLANQTTLPPEMQQQLQRFAAEKGITRGTSGNFNAFSLVKDFGFNLVDWQNASRARALNTLSTVFGMAPRVNPLSPMAMMVDPNTAIQVAGQNNAQQYQAQQSAYNSQAAARNQNASMISGAISSFGSFAGGAIRQDQALRAQYPEYDKKRSGTPAAAPGTRAPASVAPAFPGEMRPTDWTNVLPLVPRNSSVPTFP